MTGVAALPNESIGDRRPTIPAERYVDRLARSAAAARERGLDALLIGVGSDLRYLTGYVATPLERLTMLVLPAAGAARLIAPRLEALPAKGCPASAAGSVEVVAWDETDDPYELVTALLGGAGGVARIGVSDRLWALHLLRLQASVPKARFESANSVLRDLRMRKDEDEVELLRLAAHAADRVVAQIASGRLVGRTERDVAREVGERLVAEGHDAPEFAIVASGPNSASPHHEASDRVIEAGEPIVLDIGAALGGYYSDTTRTLWITAGDRSRGPDDAFLRIFTLVRDAQAAATAAVRPGVTCEDLDAVARRVITDGGHGEHFIHRLGHGIGLDIHEDPYLVGGNAEALEAGMAFSVEPGTYVEGRYGVRIEDIVVCGEDGPLALNESSRELYVVDG
jgi:Xaa-Pro aminopeptidase